MRPTAAACPPNRRCQSWCESTTTGGAPGRSYSDGRRCPIAGGTRSTSKNDAETAAPVNRSGSPAPVKSSMTARASATLDRLLPRAATSIASGAEVDATVTPPNVVPTCTSRSALGYGSGRSSTPSTTLNIVVVAPMPSPNVSTTAAVKLGRFVKLRAAEVRSWVRRSIIPMPRSSRHASLTCVSPPSAARARRRASSGGAPDC